MAVEHEFLYELTDVWKSFEGNPVLRGVNLTLCPGATLGIIGPSGSGKSVLLKCMIALLPIDGGEIRFEGKSVQHMSEDEQMQMRQRVGFQFQAGGLFDSLSVLDNLEYGLREFFFHSMSPKEMRKRAEWALEAVGLSVGDGNTLPADLSGGMQKRVGIARTIVTRPEVVLFDEPTQGLDPPNAHLISDLIADLRDELGLTALVVSHDLRTVFTVCGRVGFLDEGRILQIATPAELAASDQLGVRDFVVGHPPEEPFDPHHSEPPEPWHGRGADHVATR